MRIFRGLSGGYGRWLRTARPWPLARFFSYVCGVLLCGTGSAWAATYTLPGGLLPSGCSASGSTVTCGVVTLGNKDEVIVSSPVVWNLNGLNADANNISINEGGAASNLRIVTTGNIIIKNGVTINANIEAVGNITIDNNGRITGNISGQANVNIGNNANVDGNITAVGTVTIGNNATITGYCLENTVDPVTHVACSKPPPSDVATLLAAYRMDEAVWNGTAGELKDSANGYHGKALSPYPQAAASNPTPAPPRAGNPGTCGYSRYSGGVFQLPDVGLVETGGAVSSVSFWVYFTGNYDSEEVVLGWPGYNLYFNDDRFGINTNNGGDIRGVDSKSMRGKWTHVVAVLVNGKVDGGVIYINGVKQTLQQYKTPSTSAADLRVDRKQLYLGGQPGQSGYRFQGHLDEVRVFNGPILAAKADELYKETHPCSGGPDHIRIEHDGEGLTCAPKAVTVSACADVNCTAKYAGSVSVTLAATGDATGGSKTFTGSTTIDVSKSTAGPTTLSVSLVNPPAASSAPYRCFNGATGTCDINFVATACSFDAVEPGAQPGTNIYTKLSGAPFSLDVLALVGGSINTNYTGTVKVDLVDSSSCPSGPGLNATAGVNFDPVNDNPKGRRPITLKYDGAAKKVQVRIKAGSSAAVCSTDSFSIRPTAITLSSSAAALLSNNATNPVVKAGSDFTIGATSSTSSYNGTLTLDASKLTAQTPSQIDSEASGGVVGTLTPSSLAANAAPVNATYSEVGYVYLGPGAYRDDDFTKEDKDKGDCIADTTSDAYLADTLNGGKYGCSIGNKTKLTLGRFVPHHFDTTLTEGCSAGGFTYSAQPFPIRIEAKSAGSGAVTRNYAGVFAREVTLSDGNASGLGDFDPKIVPSTSFTAGATPALNAALAPLPVKTAFAFAAPPKPPTSIKVRVTDMDDASSSGFTEGVAHIRHGRLQLGNAYGSELLDLPIPLEAQYWTGSYYKTNGDDSCTAISAKAIALNDYKGNLSACETTLAAGTIEKGKLPLKLSKPGTGNNGSVLLTLNLGASATGKTCVSSTEENATTADFSWFAPNPSARATFGIYKTPLIYRREVYR